MKKIIGFIAIAIIVWLFWPSSEWKVDGIWKSTSTVQVKNISCSQFAFYGFDDTYSVYSPLKSEPVYFGTYYVDGDEIILDNGTVLKFKIENDFLYLVDKSGKSIKFEKFDPKDYIETETTSSSRL